MPVSSDADRQDRGARPGSRRPGFRGRPGRGLFLAMAILLLTGLHARADATAQDSTGNTGPRTGRPLPRYESLKAGEVNMRRGPGTRYMIDWVYRRRHLPVEVLAESDGWRLIRDPEGIEGWVWEQLLSSRRYGLVMGDIPAILRRDASEDSLAIARIQPGALARLERCTGNWCQTSVADFEGWLPRDRLWGLYNSEQLP